MTNLTKAMRQDFVYDYTRKIFKPKVAEAMKKLSTEKQLAEKAEVLIKQALPKMHGDNAQAKELRDVYGVKADGVFFSGLGKPVVSDDFRRNVFKFVKPANNRRSASYSRIMGFSDELMGYDNNKNYFLGDKLSFNEMLTVPPSMLNLGCWGFIGNFASFPVQVKKSQCAESGAVSEELVIADFWKTRINQKTQKRMLALVRNEREARAGVTAVLDEAASFGADLFAVLSSVRTAKKLKEGYPELWDEFSRVTDINDTAKQVTTVNTSAVNHVESVVREYRRNNAQS